MKRSGHADADYAGIWDNPYYDEQYEELKGFTFRRAIFAPKPAVRWIDKTSGAEKWSEYNGESDVGEGCEIVLGLWDHEHCDVCFVTIDEEQSYWRSTEKNRTLCDACHEHYHVQPKS